jgi:hypothetical protein
LSAGLASLTSLNSDCGGKIAKNSFADWGIAQK